MHHYARGEADWIVRGLPTEPPAPLAERLRALPYFVNNVVPAVRRAWIVLSRRASVGHSVRTDVPRLRPDDPAPPGGAGRVTAVVLDGDDVLLGTVERGEPGRPACATMNPAPQTIRPDMGHDLAAALLRHAPYLVVTTALGRYVGVYAPTLVEPRRLYPPSPRGMTPP